MDGETSNGRSGGTTGDNPHSMPQVLDDASSDERQTLQGYSFKYDV